MLPYSDDFLHRQQHELLKRLAYERVLDPIHNKSFTIWQRGPGLAFNVASGVNTMIADRWGVVRDGTGGAEAVIRAANTGITQPPITELTGANITCTVAPTGQTINRLFQCIPNAWTFANEVVTLSFWARLNSGTATGFSVEIDQDFGVGGAPSAVVINGPQPFTPTVVYQRFDFTFTLPTVIGKTFGTTAFTDCLKLRVNLPLNALFNVEFKMFQLEAGPEFTRYISRDWAQEMALCAQFYKKSFPYATAPATNTGIFNNVAQSQQVLGAGAATTTLQSIHFGMPMFAIPTVTLYNPAAANNQVRDRSNGTDCTASVASDISENGFVIYFTTSGTSGIGHMNSVHWDAAAQPGGQPF